MNEYFNWSKVYSVSHAQGNYFIFTIEYGEKNHAGIMLPATMDDIWYIAGSRLIDIIGKEEVAANSHEEVLDGLNNWMSQNLRGKFSIAPVEGMYPPMELEEAEA
jgi:hypothetical protein